MSELDFRVIFVLTYTAFAAVRLRYRLLGPRERGERRGTGTWGTVLSLLILSFFASVSLYLIDHPWVEPFQGLYPVYLRWVGLGSSISIIPLLIWTHRTLGGQYSATLRLIEGHALVVEGPYRGTRHPLYTIFWSFGTSVSLVTGNLLLVALSLVLIIPLYFISIEEERMMLGRFGEDYRDYMERTGRFLPRIGRTKYKAVRP